MQKQNRLVLKSAQLQVASDLGVLPKVVEWFQQFQEPPIPRAIWSQGNVALIEGFTNAVRHAHRDLNPCPPVTVEVIVLDGIFQFEIWDQGKPYDLEATIIELQHIMNQPDFDPLVREQHWGSVVFFKLIRQHHWQINYTRPDETQNCLRATVAF